MEAMLNLRGTEEVLRRRKLRDLGPQQSAGHTGPSAPAAWETADREKAWREPSFTVRRKGQRCRRRVT